jgi:hypothetical protein
MRPDVVRALAMPWSRYDDVIPVVHVEGVKLVSECEGFEVGGISIPLNWYMRRLSLRFELWYTYLHSEQGSDVKKISVHTSNFDFV